jgi:hypothetical protein
MLTLRLILAAAGRGNVPIEDLTSLLLQQDQQVDDVRGLDPEDSA